MRLLWFWAVALALGQTPPVPQADWKRAVDLHQQGQYDAAAAAYAGILQSAPDFVPALSNLGAVYSRLGRYADAAAQYRKALDRQPEHFGIRLNLAIALYQQRLLGQAIPELERLNQAQPDHQQVALLLGDSYLRTGEDKKVIALFDPWIARGNRDRALMFLLGTALIREKQWDRGQRVIDFVLRDGESAESLMLLGATQFAAQDNRKAIETLEKAIAVNPKLPELHSLYGRARLTDGDPEAAKAAFLKELEHNPSDFEANLHLGTLYRIDKEEEKAAPYLERARRIRPRSMALLYQLGSLELSRGNLSRAAELLEEVTRESPQFVEGHITLATVYYRLKRKADGDRERAIVDQLNAEAQAKDLKTK